MQTSRCSFYLSIFSIDGSLLKRRKLINCEKSSLRQNIDVYWIPIPVDVHRNTPPLPERNKNSDSRAWLISSRPREESRAGTERKLQKKRERTKRKRSHRTVIWLTPSDTDACLCVNVQGCRSISSPPLLLSLSLSPSSSSSIFLHSPLYLSQSVQAYRRASIYPGFSPGAIKVSANHATRQPLGRTISRFVHWLVRFPLGQSRQLAPALRRVVHTLQRYIRLRPPPRASIYLPRAFYFHPVHTRFSVLRGLVLSRYVFYFISFFFFPSPPFFLLLVTDFFYPRG